MLKVFFGGTIMKAIILAAGRGSRMCQLTEDQPKCLTQLAGKSLLEWQQEALKAAGIQEIVVVGGYRHEDLKGDFQVFENKRWTETNMVRSLCEASEILESEEAIISYSDIVFNSKHAKNLMNNDAEIAVSYDQLWLDLWSLRFIDPLSDAETFKSKNGILVEIGAKTNLLDSIQGQYMGLLKITPIGWKKITSFLRALSDAEIDKLDMTSMLSILLKGNVTINTIAVQGGWCEVDTANDLHKYEAEIANNKNWSHDWRDN